MYGRSFRNLLYWCLRVYMLLQRHWKVEVQNKFRNGKSWCVELSKIKIRMWLLSPLLFFNSLGWQYINHWYIASIFLPFYAHKCLIVIVCGVRGGCLLCVYVPYSEGHFLFILVACCVDWHCMCVLVCMFWREEGPNILLLLKKLKVLQVLILPFESFLFVV